MFPCEGRAPDGPDVQGFAASLITGLNRCLRRGTKGNREVFKRIDLAPNTDRSINANVDANRNRIARNGDGGGVACLTGRIEDDAGCV
jgi:hypothetical protein